VESQRRPPAADRLDFTELDAIVQPVLEVTDHSPQLQLAVAPALPGLVDANGELIPSPRTSPSWPSTSPTWFATITKVASTGRQALSIA